MKRERAETRHMYTAGGGKLNRGNAVKRFASLTAATALLCACAFVPVKEQTLKNAYGGEITCKQVGTGVISSSVGKSRFDDCVANAKANGYQ